MARSGVSVTLMFAMALVLNSLFAASLAGPTQRNATYMSTDMDSVIVFEDGQVRFGPFLAIYPGGWASSTAEYLTPNDDIECVSTGPRDYSVQFAIKRPIHVADHYSCARTTFVVLRCFMHCRSAVVRMERPLGGGAPGTLTSYLYVDSCLGMIAYSQSKDFLAGIPLDAAWLRGSVGVLASKSYPQCRLF
jgi:hypothetical protein